MNRAKQIRLDHGMRAVDVASEAGISTRTLKKVEAGEDVASTSLARLATFYAVKPSTLLMPAIEEERAA